VLYLAFVPPDVASGRLLALRDRVSAWLERRQPRAAAARGSGT